MPTTPGRWGLARAACRTAWPVGPDRPTRKSQVRQRAGHGPLASPWWATTRCRPHTCSPRQRAGAVAVDLQSGRLMPTRDGVAQSTSSTQWITTRRRAESCACLEFPPCYCTRWCLTRRRSESSSRRSATDDNAPTRQPDIARYGRTSKRAPTREESAAGLRLSGSHRARGQPPRYGDAVRAGSGRSERWSTRSTGTRRTCGGCRIRRRRRAGLRRQRFGPGPTALRYRTEQSRAPWGRSSAPQRAALGTAVLGTAVSVLGTWRAFFRTAASSPRHRGEWSCAPR
jgi:hypothetical protein